MSACFYEDSSLFGILLFCILNVQMFYAERLLFNQFVSNTYFPSSMQSSSTDVSRMKTIRESDSSKKSEPIASNSKSIATSDAIADLLDLEIELSSIQQGISQMEKLTPSDPFGPSAAGREDPFGDSFSPPPVTSPQPNKLPPPPSKLDKSDSIRSSDSSHKSSISKMQPDKHWFDKETEDIFESTDFPSTTSNNSSTAPTSTASAPIAKEESLVCWLFYLSTSLVSN